MTDDDGAFAGLASERVLDEPDIGITIMGPDGRVRAGNRGFRTTRQPRGVTVDEAGWYSRDIHQVSEAGTPRAPHDVPPMRTFRTGEAISNELIGTRVGDGTTSWDAVTTGPVVDPTTGPVTSVICTYIDVTELRRAQAELQ
jgi:hypothetical protein